MQLVPSCSQNKNIDVYCPNSGQFWENHITSDIRRHKKRSSVQTGTELNKENKPSFLTSFLWFTFKIIPASSH